jgi:hypothetical protein
MNATVCVYYTSKNTSYRFVMPAKIRLEHVISFSDAIFAFTERDVNYEVI